jgi:L-ascorbate metabolism protein UlaG (beta-lactamase superfamily)
MDTNDLTVEWFGCTTFRVRVSGLTLWFDTFVDRVPDAEPVGVQSDDIDRADFVFVSHAHFDHLLGADTVARNTGAPIVASYESIRVMRENDVEAAQLWPVSGGEQIVCGNDVRVRVFPSLHSCLFADASGDSGAPCLGDLGVAYQERRQRQHALFELLEGAVNPDYAHAIAHRTGRDDGGQLNYLLETSRGSLFIAASSGYWSGILRDLRADAAILAVSGRPNLDGEPYQGSLADFVVGEIATLRPERVLFCHHDAWMPPLPAVDTGAAARAISEHTPNATLLEPAYGDPVRLSP